MKNTNVLSKIEVKKNLTKSTNKEDFKAAGRTLTRAIGKPKNTLGALWTDLL